MANERLRTALLRKGTTVAELAEAVGVDAKTVERWISRSRVPYRKHRFAVARLLGVEESFLWPEALTPAQSMALAESEIVAVYPHRWTVPKDAWGRLFSSAREEIDVLVYSGIFIAQDTGIVRVLAARADAGVRVRMLLGDPDSREVAQRGADEGIGNGVAEQVKTALVFYRTLRQHQNVEIRFHHTVLYNSVYRADDQLMVNTHVYGTFAANAPVMHLRRVPGGSMVTTYLVSFEAVWEQATPVRP